MLVYVSKVIHDKVKPHISGVFYMSQVHLRRVIRPPRKTKRHWAHALAGKRCSLLARF